jgi:RimJ/RimL family protein N-acetyltransferase
MDPFPWRIELGEHPGVVLRTLELDDWIVEYDLSRVPDVPRWTMYPPDLDEERARLRADLNLQLAATGMGIRYVIDERGTALGTAGIGRGRHGFEVFYALKPEARGRGVVTGAVGALVSWLNANGERDVWLSTLDGNAASENVARRAGFEPVDAGAYVDGRPLTNWRRRG